MLEVVLLTLLAGLAIPAGASIALVEHFRSDWLETEFRHSVIAFGGGVLLSAVALVLVPEGSESLPSWGAVSQLLCGGAVFMGLDVWLSRRRGSASQLVAMLADFVPEAIALGATFSVDRTGGALLALLIGLQNLPEGFNALRELRASSNASSRRLLLLMGGAALLGPLCGVLGYSFLSEQDAVVGALMLVAAGGILYLTFEDIAPQAHLENRFAPALGSVLGFGAGLLGQLLISPG